MIEPVQTNKNGFLGKMVILLILGVFATPIAFFIMLKKRNIKYFTIVPVLSVFLALVISFIEFNDAKTKLALIDKAKSVELSADLEIGARPFFITAYVEKDNNEYVAISGASISYVPLYSIGDNCEKELVGWLRDPKQSSSNMIEAGDRCGLTRLELDVFSIVPSVSSELRTKLSDYSGGKELSFIALTDSRKTFEAIYDKGILKPMAILISFIFGFCIFLIMALCAICGDYFNMPTFSTILSGRLRNES